MNVASSTTKTNPKIRSGDQEHTVAAAKLCQQWPNVRKTIIEENALGVASNLGHT